MTLKLSDASKKKFHFVMARGKSTNTSLKLIQSLCRKLFPSGDGRDKNAVVDTMLALLTSVNANGIRPETVARFLKHKYKPGQDGNVIVHRNMKFCRNDAVAKLVHEHVPVHVQCQILGRVFTKIANNIERDFGTEHRSSPFPFSSFVEDVLTRSICTVPKETLGAWSSIDHVAGANQVSVEVLRNEIEQRDTEHPDNDQLLSTLTRFFSKSDILAASWKADHESLTLERR